MKTIKIYEDYEYLLRLWRLKKIMWIYEDYKDL
jgi:hypothetical protein